PLVVEIEPLQVARARHFTLTHAADEQVVLPLRELVAGVDHQARWCDRGHPEGHWRIHVLAIRIHTHPRTEIKAAGSDDRPAVVVTRQQLVHFVAAVRSVLHRPDRAVLRIHRQAEDVAMTKRENLGTVSGLAEEW